MASYSHHTVLTKMRDNPDLKKRLYLGPTSLDPSLAIIMANMAGVRRGHLAFDPFAGTASILVALAHFGTFGKLLWSITADSSNPILSPP